MNTKSRCLRFIPLLFGIVSSNYCLADKPYLDGNRIEYIARTLKAFADTKLQNIFNTYRYLGVIDNNNCRSSISDLRVRCLLSYADKNCSEIKKTNLQKNCQLYSDIIVVNKLSEDTFIGRSERYRIANSKDYNFRTALENRLRQKYARIVTEFSLSDAASCKANDLECLAKGLDQFCLEYTNSQNLSWQYCMSASLWFIGTSNRD